MADLSDAPSRKRRPATYMSKDDVDADHSSEDEGPQERKTFKRASEDEISQRQKVTVRRSGSGAAAPRVSAADKFFGSTDKASPPAHLVPKPTVGEWKAPTLNFGGVAKPTESTAAPAAKTAEAAPSKPVGDAKASSVPNAFSKPFAFSGAFGKPPVAAAASDKKPESADKKSDTSAPASDAAAPATATVATTPSTHSKPAAFSPTAGTGYKFASVSTNWNIPKATPAATEGGSSPAGAAAPKKWSFLGGKPISEYKPAALSSHFAKSAAAAASSTDGASKSLSTGFQFGKGVPPPKPTEMSAKVSQAVESAKTDSTEDAASSLQAHPTVQMAPVDEHENTLFKGDAKLFEFDVAAKKWVERGLGLFRVNQFKEDAARHRLLMHAKSTLKLILNTPLFAGMSVTPMDKQPSCVKFTGIPVPEKKKETKDNKDDAAVAAESSSDKSTIAIFNLRFKDAETAALALKTIKDALEAKPATSGAEKPAEAPKTAEAKKEEAPAVAAAAQ